VIDPEYGIPFTDPARPGSGEAQADKHRRHKKVRGPLRGGVPGLVPGGGGSGQHRPPRHRAPLAFVPYGDHTLVRNWAVEVGHPNSGPRGRDLEDLGTDDDQVPRRALEFLASPRGSRILRDIAAGTHEGNIARNPFHPLALDQAGQEPGESWTSALAPATGHPVVIGSGAGPGSLPDWPPQLGGRADADGGVGSGYRIRRGDLRPNGKRRWC